SLRPHACAARPGLERGNQPPHAGHAARIARPRPAAAEVRLALTAQRWPTKTLKPPAGPKMIVLIDNYDSFTFNLVHYLGELGADVVVHRNNKVSAREVIDADPDAIVLSPGPCTPNEAGICLELVGQAAPKIPMFGVCLGLQSIGQ